MCDHAPRAPRNPLGRRFRIGGEVVEPQLGDVDYDAALRGARQHVEGRNRDLRARTGQPRVDAGIRLLELLEADVEGAREAHEGIFVAGFDDLNLAEDLVAFADPKLRGLRCTDAEKAK